MSDDGHAAGKPDLAVDNDGAAMVPAVEAGELPELRRSELLNFTAGRYQRLEIFVGHLDAAETVEQHAHLTPSRCFFSSARAAGR